MNNTLAENIRIFRKNRGLTQEQLAQVLGVTAGAVYKWEAQLSQPELSLILDLADFFDTSVDVLVGYSVRDNSLSATVARLNAHKQSRDPAGLADAEKALQKYPDCFEVVHLSASLFFLHSLLEQDAHKRSNLLARSLSLLEQARILLPQNRVPEISEGTLCCTMAEVLLHAGQPQRALDLLKAHNAGDIYADHIAMICSQLPGHTHEAVISGSRALLHALTALVRVIVANTNVCFNSRRYAQAEGMLEWGIALFRGLKDGNRPCALDRSLTTFLVCLSRVRLEQGRTDDSRKLLLDARELALGFDAAPSYVVRSIRFIDSSLTDTVYDDLGETAMDGLRKALADIGSQDLNSLWKEVDHHGYVSPQRPDKN